MLNEELPQVIANDVIISYPDCRNLNVAGLDGLANLLPHESLYERNVVAHALLVELLNQFIKSTLSGHEVDVFG